MYQRNSRPRYQPKFNQGRNGSFRPQARRVPQKINPNFFIQKAVYQEVVEYSPTHSFTDFDFSPQIKQNITSHGYTHPTPIQDQTIPHLLAGKDVIGIASTGTGKTAAFLLPLIQKVSRDYNQRVLIIAPTRELAVQIQDELKKFTQNMRVYSVLCIGGVGMYPQIKGLYRNPSFVIGTPGRLRDLEQQRKLSFANYKTIVLDEVDRMLDMGFVNEVKYIMEKLSSPRQSLFFSATVTSEVRRIMDGFVKDAITVSVSPSRPSANVDQDIVRIGGKQKIEVLCDLLFKEEFKKVLVFGRTKHGMEKLSRELLQKGFRVAAIHGNKTQSQRQRAIQEFKQDRIQALLATDVASRGLDINDVTHVINFDQPESYEDYIHRIGRTGRANKKGIALTFVD